MIDFFVLDPNYQVIFSRRGKDEGIFRFNSTMPGQYSFVFSNMNDKHMKKSVTVAIHPGYEESAADAMKTSDEIREMAKAAGVDEIEIKTLNVAVKDMNKKIKNLFTEAKMSMIRQDGHNQAVDYNQKITNYMNLFEICAFIGICAYNLYHIKGILENRRII